METGFRPIGSGLPARRDELIPVMAGESTRDSEGAIYNPSIELRSSDRMLDILDRDMEPQQARMILQAAIFGDMAQQRKVFNSMIDSWPRLQKAIAELKRAARRAPWKVLAWALRGEKPDEEAERIAKMVENGMWAMKPRAQHNELGFEEIIEALVDGYLCGHEVLQWEWVMTADGWMPRCATLLTARHYGYPSIEDTEDRLMLDRTGGRRGTLELEDFPEHNFLIAVNRAHGGHPTVAAPLRALLPYWMAVKFGLRWMMDYTQIYGVPFRHGKAADKKAQAAMAAAFSKMASRGYIITEPGSEVVPLAGGNSSGQSLPQRELIKLANEECDIFILGQTLTSSQGDKGSQALGTVHMGVRQDVIVGLCDWIGAVLTRQLAPAILYWNFRENAPEAPGIWAEWPEEINQKERSEILENLKGADFKMGRDWGYQYMGIPMPAEGEPLLFEETEGGGDVPDEEETNPTDDEPDKPGKKAKVTAADAGEWEHFGADTGTLGIPRREMPQILSSNRAAMVQFLRSRGIESREETVDPASLKPTQAEYSPAKVEAARNYQGGNRAILISEDDHVVDGHHQWMGDLQAERPIRVIRLMAPIARVLMMTHRMPSTQVAASIREDYPDDAPTADPQKLFTQVEETLRSGSVVDWKAVALMMAVGLAEGASGEGEGAADE